MHTSETPLAEDIYRLTLAPKPHFEFSQFLLLDDKNCLVHAGKRAFFEPLRGMVEKRLAGRQLDYIVFSHVEADESGAVNEWLTAYPDAVVVCNKVANMNLEDYIVRPARILKDGELLPLGTKTLQLIETPHFPHNWDAHMWFEETTETLFSSDYCCQGGICEPVVDSDISEVIIDFYIRGGFIPYGKTTNENVDKLKRLPVKTIAPMHGSVITGESVQTILEKVGADLRGKSVNPTPST